MQTANHIFGLALAMLRASAPRIRQAQEGPCGSRATHSFVWLSGSFATAAPSYTISTFLRPSRSDSRAATG